MLLVLAKGAVLLIALAGLMRYALTPALHRLAHTPELLVLASITWAAGLAAGTDALGFSKEVGAFLAGVSLASTPYREAIAGRLVSLRDFLLLFFFIDLGAGLDLSGLAGQLDRVRTSPHHRRWTGDDLRVDVRDSVFAPAL